jgi:uncharacterized protein YecE (DUF72 family)
MEHERSNILIGIGGWEHEIFDGLFYPSGITDPIHRLSLIASTFDVTEVRATFWDDGLNARDAAEWSAAAAVNSRFRFVVKLHKAFTHRKCLTPASTKNMRGLLHELARQDRLGGLLMQFPYCFTNTGANRNHLTKLSEVFSGFPVFVEIRHFSWDQDFLPGFMEDLGIHPVNVDLPRLRQYISCRSDAVAGMAYLRLHGRNERAWLQNHPDRRYEYLYNGPEITEVKRRVERLSGKADKVFVSFNNTAMAGALVNGFQLSAAIEKGRKQRIPSALIDRYPVLSGIASVDNAQHVLPIFGEFRDVV